MGRYEGSTLLPSSLISLSSTSDTTKEGGGGRGEWFKRTLVGVAVGLSFPILFPLGHLLLFSYLWGSFPVDKKACTNSCWDTVFKGPYETGVGGYKHVYFNATPNTGKMWVITVLGVVFLYETFKHLTLLAYKRRLRHSMAALVLSSLHSHYYAWWGHWKYWNDEFYSMWNHQLFFTITELASTLAVLANIDARTALKPLPLVLVGNVALFHVLSSSFDQFFSNFIAFQGRVHQVLGDVFLMSTDILQFAIALYQLRRTAESRGMSLRQLLRQKSHLWCIAITTSIMFIYVTFCP